MDRSEKAVRAHLDELVRRCRDNGLSITPQRLAVYRAVLAADDHPSPDTLASRLRSAMPSLSLATVYKTLDTLVELGLVRELYGNSPEKRYDGNLERHHHLVCERCGGIEDIYEPRFDTLAPPKKLRGFKPHHVRVSIDGECRACARAAKGRRRRRLAVGA